ncbi:MAG: hypothetical protein EI684_05770 [Candidatus Viridilinea halotolerans]|uniref:Roadblock/LC7 domain-containing protein n=1 Tax=Candidatus Viridilinea halotolerans TaxID=2491704 RepID=A0A426U4Z9_9CHLR|nr:MAG: hypothetical protein EI684_05770 [Candidatus Viridilinea halotolerans]
MHRTQPALSAAALATIHGLLGQLSQQAHMRCAFLCDLGGQELASWTEQADLDLVSLAALAAGDLMATMEIARILGGKRACNVIIQEHDEMIILVARVGEGLVLLMATGVDVPVGWSRLAIKRTSDRILEVVGSAAMTPPPLVMSDDFVASFNAQIDTIW